MHVISNLNIGGAEMSLCSLVEGTAGKTIEHTVISLLPNGALRPRLERAGATVVELTGKRGLAGVRLLQPLARAMMRARPDLVHAWMYHANVAMTILEGLGAFACPLIWSIRQSAEHLALDRRLTRALIKFGAVLSARPAAIVYNSMIGANSHEALGYAAGRRWVIPNGVNCDRFKPRPEARAALNAELGLEHDTILIGRVARYAPMKDYQTLLQAHRQVLDSLPDAHLIMIGGGISASNAELVALCRQHGCQERVHFLGPRLDIEAIFPAFDVLVSASRANEGFPNVVAEGLASGVLVVSTSSGEEQLIRNGVHAIVPPRHPEAMGAAIIDLLAISDETKHELKERGRSFIQNNFSLASSVEQYCNLYSQMLSPATPLVKARVKGAQLPAQAETRTTVQ